MLKLNLPGPTIYTWHNRAIAIIDENALIKRKPTKKDWQAILAQALKVEPKVAGAILDGVARVKGMAKVNVIGRAAAKGNVRAVLDAIDFDELGTMNPVIAKALRALMEQSAEAAAALLPKEAVIQFDLVNPKAVEWMRNQGGKLITMISDTTRETLKDVIVRAFNEGRPPLVAARDIINHIGLTPRLAMAVANHRSLLEQEGAKEIEAKVQRYAERLLRYRARMIARTETKEAAIKGQQLLWEQAQRDGLLSQQARKFWLLSADPCKQICRPIPGLNPNGVLVSANFSTPAGSLQGPPGHPNCRCGMTMRVIK